MLDKGSPVGSLDALLCEDEGLPEEDGGVPPLLLPLLLDGGGVAAPLILLLLLALPHGAGVLLPHQ